MIPQSDPQDWYLVNGNKGPSQWFSEESLERVIAIALVMTGARGMSGADQVTLEDSSHRKLVTFIANEDHRGCHLVVPHDSSTTREDLLRLKHFMAAYDLLIWVEDGVDEAEEPVESAQ